ncbi:hypothetical protein [uncultured Lutibacter sp.]|uniref:hypothetical protein n=1 Tax=uncultured Lutibacter sp. TaxID=437739 RepID=UPI0026282B13|nr:hypothetical protein [uncultured Lutibacter sp.]
MKHIIFPLTFLITFFSFGQIRIDIESIDILDETTISVKVFAQNLGARTTLWNVNTSNNYQNETNLNFSVEYDYIPTGNHIILPPTSISIKTIYGGAISMESPYYQFDSTGSESGEKWEIIFHQLPRESGNVIVNILGEMRVVGDMPLAEEARKEKLEEFYAVKDSKIFDYKEFYPEDYRRIKDDLKTTILNFISNNNLNNISGYINFIVDKDGNTNIDISFNLEKLNKFLEKEYSETKLKPTSKLGYQLKSNAKYDITYSKGKVRLTKKEGKISKTNIELPKELSELFRKKTDYMGKFTIYYDVFILNGKVSKESKIDVQNYKFGNFKL